MSDVNGSEYRKASSRSNRLDSDDVGEELVFREAPSPTFASRPLTTAADGGKTRCKEVYQPNDKARLRTSLVIEKMYI